LLRRFTATSPEEPENLGLSFSLLPASAHRRFHVGADLDAIIEVIPGERFDKLFAVADDQDRRKLPSRGGCRVGCA
jgi:hypothetical protein